MYETNEVSNDDVCKIFEIEENYFYDFKAKDIKPAKLSISVSAFANASGGELYVGIREDTRTKVKHWEGFNCVEDCNAIISALSALYPTDNYLSFDYLQHPTSKTYVLHITVRKTKAIIKSTDDKIFVRKNAQNIELKTPEEIHRLELDKGISSFEDEMITETSPNDALDSNVLKGFIKNVIPQTDGLTWIKKQHLCDEHHLSLAGTLLFVDEPQIYLPKRSAIKIFRYKTSGDADRDTLAETPITIEGCAYNQIYASVRKVKEIVESIKRVGKTFEGIRYPEETLHEIITNAVLHRDYSIVTDIQIRIFDNRIEIESPGKLPGHVTVDNILETQAARNPKVVRLINKFPNPPNKDVGEGLNTAFDAMEKLRLKPPVITERESSVCVFIKHERLASPEEIIVNYLRDNERVRNSIGRELTGIKSENAMKRVFYSLQDRGFIQLVKGINYWIKTKDFNKLADAQFPQKQKQ